MWVAACLVANLEAADSVGAYEVEGWRRRKDGKRLWAHVGVTPLRTGSGTLRGFAMIIRDITGRRTGGGFAPPGS